MSYSIFKLTSNPAIQIKFRKMSILFSISYCSYYLGFSLISGTHGETLHYYAINIVDNKNLTCKTIAACKIYIFPLYFIFFHIITYTYSLSSDTLFRNLGLYLAINYFEMHYFGVQLPYFNRDPFYQYKENLGAILEQLVRSDSSLCE